MTASDPEQPFDQSVLASEKMFNWLPNGMPLSRLWKPILLLFAFGVVGSLLKHSGYVDRYYLLFAAGGIIVAIGVASLSYVEVSKFMRNGENTNDD